MRSMSAALTASMFPARASRSALSHKAGQTRHSGAVTAIIAIDNRVSGYDPSNMDAPGAIASNRDPTRRNHAIPSPEARSRLP